LLRAKNKSVLAKTGNEIYIKNRPSHSRRAIGFDLSYPSTSKASPNDTWIVIIIIIIGEVVVVKHRGADYSTELFGVSGIDSETIIHNRAGFLVKGGKQSGCGLQPKGERGAGLFGQGC
jgi:hypothetical protein